MAAGGKGGIEEWRLGVELGSLEEFEAAEAAPAAARDHSVERLERPLLVVTAEHLGWAAVAGWALVSRLVMLGARPLDSAEARHALDELALLHQGAVVGAHLGWVNLAEAAAFAVFGAGDFAARIAYALSGLLLVAAGFAMRRHVGRAGALAFAALLALSPSAAYFARSGNAIVPALAFAVLALAAFLELCKKPTRAAAAGVGAAAGLGLASGPPAMMTALFLLAALAAAGLGQAMVGRRVVLQVRVWWTRRKALLLIGVLVAAALWASLESGLATRSPLDAVVTQARSNLAPTGEPGFRAGLDFYLPILSLYEFLVVILAVLSALAVLAMRVRSRLAAGALIWSAAAVTFYLWTPQRSPALVLQMIVPMALLGAFAVDYLHHTPAWTVIRYPLAALALLTLYVQAVNSFVLYAPDASEAPWARRALLFWSEPATTFQAPQECARVLAELPAHGARVFFADGSPVLRWYLRELSPAANAETASAIVGGAETTSLPQTDVQARYDFELSAAWRPRWRSLRPASTLRYLLDARAWSPLETERATIVVRRSVPTAPTVIFAPAAPPAAAPSAEPPASTPTRGAASSALPPAAPAQTPKAVSASASGPQSAATAGAAQTPAAAPATPAATPAGGPPSHPPA